VEDHARQIVALSVGEPEPVAVVCDHDAEDRATLERHLGRSTVAAHKAITTGIEAVQARLRPAGDGRPRLFYLRDSLVERDPQLDEHTYPCSLPEEITGYVWQPAKDGRAAKEEPVKLHDHACDTTRYLVAQVDLVGRPNLRWL
jgi:phage terminase large subunit